MKNLGILMKYEWKKLFQRKIVWVTLLIMVSLLIISNLSFLMGVNTYIYTDTDGMVRHVRSGYEMMMLSKENAQKLDGQVIDDTLWEEIKAGTADVMSNPYEVIYMVTNSIVNNKPQMYTMSTNELYQMWEDKMRSNILSEKYITTGEIAYWEKEMEKIETPFVYEYCQGWVKVLPQALTNSVLVLMLVAIGLAGIFADEHRWKTDQMILCMKNGRKIMYYAKAFVGMLFGAGCAVLLYGISFGFSFFFWGAEGFDAMLQLEVTFSPYALTIGEAVLIIFALTILSGILESMFAMYLSEHLNNGVAVMAILVGIMLATQVIRVPETWRVLYQAWNLLPTNLATPWTFMDGRLIPILGGYLNNVQFGAIIYVFISFVFFWLGKRRYEGFQVCGR